MKRMENWKGKHILVVGASEGIGKATAFECARRGAKLSLAARSEKVKETVSGLEGKEHAGFCFDVSEIEKIDRFIDELVKTRGALDGVVYCVGPQCVRPLKMLKPEVVAETMSVGFSAYIEFVRAVTRKGNYKEPMSIVSISSIAAKTGSPGKTVYGAMKAAVDAAVRSLSVELAPKGIRLNTVAPGMVATKRLERLEQMVGGDGQLKEVEKRQYLGVSNTVDIAKTICFLLGEEAKAITGTSMDVSGGFLTS